MGPCHAYYLKGLSESNVFDLDFLMSDYFDQIHRTRKMRVWTAVKYQCEFDIGLNCDVFSDEMLEDFDFLGLELEEGICRITICSSIKGEDGLRVLTVFRSLLDDNFEVIGVDESS